MNHLWSISRRKAVSVLLLSFILGCEADLDIQSVDLEERMNPAVLQQHNENDPGALLLENSYFWGVSREDKTVEKTKEHLELLSFLSNRTGYEFSLLYVPTDISVSVALGQDTVQFGGVEILSYLKANKTYGIEMLAKGSVRTKRAVFIVSKASELSSIGQLTGKRMALYPKASIEGELLPRMMFNKKQASFPPSEKLTYSESIETCLEAMLVGQVDVCALDEGVAKPFFDSEKMRVLARSEEFPESGVASNIYVDGDVIIKVQQALIEYREAYKLINVSLSPVIIKAFEEFSVNKVSE